MCAADQPSILRRASVRACAVALVTVLAGCHPEFPKYDYSKEPDPRLSELVLGAGDQIAINVWDNTNLNTEATIRPDGTITMPLIGDLKADGETPTGLKARIKARLLDFVKSTEVTVAVKAWKSYRFTIQGEVGHAGVFTSDQYVTVSEALALAGGLSRFAKPAEIVLTRRKAGKQVHIPLDYDQLTAGKRTDMNIYALPGDTIFVP
jgi:polysaccharide biosynthesis/export protein